MYPLKAIRFSRFAAASLTAAALLAAGCESVGQASNKPDEAAATPAGSVAPASGGSTAPAKSVQVGIDNFSFNPPTLTISAGTTVVWTNHDDIPHTVTASDKSYSSTGLDSDEKYSRLYSVPGTYSYFCAVHPHMTGRIVVK